MSSGLCGLNTKAETVGSTEKRHPVLNGIKILSRESIGKSVLLFPFFYAFFWSAYYDCQKKTNGKQKIFSCKKSVCEVSENTKNSGNRE